VMLVRNDQWFSRPGTAKENKAADGVERPRARNANNERPPLPLARLQRRISQTSYVSSVSRSVEICVRRLIVNIVVSEEFQSSKTNGLELIEALYA
jgi:hypothetical protein